MLSVQQQPLLIEQIDTRGDLSSVHYRPLQPSDFLAVKAAHAALFPIDYDDSFFHKATNAIDRIWSCAAFCMDSYGGEHLVGFITAKTVSLHECDVTDRQHLGLLSPVVDHDQVLYILTLGVLEGYRHQGIASTLINMVGQHGCKIRCRAVFLHVITYNTAAQALYSRQGFTCVARLSNFYYISTGRQPDPSTLVYDAYLYVQFIGVAGGLVSPWDMVTLAWMPLRSALGKIHSCVPGFRRKQQLPQYHLGLQEGSSSHTTAPTPAEDPSRSSKCSNSASSCSSPCPGKQLQLQHASEHPQQSSVWSRYRHRRAGCPTFVTSNGTAISIASNATQQQQQQPPLQQQGQQLAVYQQHMLQPHKHGLSSQVPSCQLPQQQHQPPHHQAPQHMLRWLFNGSSRSTHSSSSQQPQVFTASDERQAQ